MVERRFAPVIVCVALAFLGLGLRLFQVQVLQYEIWASEAVNLVREGTIEPHRRGKIRDRKGRVIATDELVYEVEFVWRQFRRGHPLGQVAQMRSLLLMRPVSLAETCEQLFTWADELIHLSPADIDAFGGGAEVFVQSLQVPASTESSADRRWARAGDLHYYVKALLDLDRGEARRVSKMEDPELRRLSYLELAARVRGVTSSAVREDLYRRLDESVVHLGGLARALGLEDRGEQSGLMRLVQQIEGTRRGVEDSTADDLFQKATGFGAWRVHSRNLARIDLDWLRRCLYWDEARLDQWVLDRGGLWPRIVDSYLAGHTLARFKVGASEPGNRVLSALLHFFQPPERRSGVHAATPRDWRTSDELVVLSTLDQNFTGTPRGSGGSMTRVLPVQDEDLRRAHPPSDVALVTEVLARTWRDSPAYSGERIQECAETLVELAGRSRMTWHAHEIDDIRSILKTWNQRLQAEIARRMDRLAGAGEVVTLLPASVKVATEERAYVVRDRGARPTRLASDPGYDLVQLVTRYPRRYAGFVVRNRTRRAVVQYDFPEGDVPVANELIGRVRSPYLARLLEQRAEELELHGLQTQLRRTEQDEPRIRELINQLVRADEFRGGSGIEAYFDPELRGKNGYRETQGLQDRRNGKRKPIFEPPVDGEDLTLTLDLDLQRAAQDVLLHPDPLPESDLLGDPVWLAQPVGAIVLLTPEGDVLAAASVPVRPGQPGPNQDGEAAFAIDRTLRRPRGEPPGSVFKPFVAAWALQYGGLDPNARLVPCQVEGSEAAHYGGVHCHARNGHSTDAGGSINLSTALHKSCNSYFAFLGERYMDSDAFREMASTYGFGQPVGVRSHGDLRSGWVENYLFDGPLAATGTEMRDVERQRLGNGLSHIDVTPMQVARAYAGLATGSLPELRLVRSSGEGTSRVRSRPLPIEPQHLRRIQEALRNVVASSGGTGNGKGLGQAQLGFELAAKTGSADYKVGPVPNYPLASNAPGEPIQWVDGMRKHTWIAGWFPASEPRAILVVYVHDTSSTSSHGAVYLAGQFLRQPALQDFLLEEGVALNFEGR
ncbi:MAG: cell division protein FtsI/penicillin-binding protein 2 [Chlamydiales bacterium]